MVLQYRVFIPNTKRKIYFTLITFQFYFNKSIVSHFVKYSSSKEANLHLIRSLFISMHQYYGKRLLAHNSVFTIKQRSEVICQRNETISVSHEVLEKWYTPYYIYSQWQKNRHYGFRLVAAKWLKQIPPKFIATCSSFNLRYLSGQLINIEEFYSNFSDSNLRNFRQWKSWFF